MKYYIDDTGNYLGGSDSPLSLNEVPFAPNDARQAWNGTDYDPLNAAAIEATKDAQVNAEFRLVEIAMETLIPLINPSLNITDIINQAKAKRKQEL